MSFLEKALEAIPAAAQNPLALVAFLAVIVVWAYLIHRTSRLKILMAAIQTIPEADRRSLVENELGERLPQTITAAEWLQGRRQRYRFITVLMLAALVALIAGLSCWYAAQSLALEIESKVHFVTVPGSFGEDGRMPLATPITVRIEEVPRGATITWQKPCLGSLDTNVGNAVVYTPTKVGREQFHLDVRWFWFRFSPNFSLEVADPFLTIE